MLLDPAIRMIRPQRARASASAPPARAAAGGDDRALLAAAQRGDRVALARIFDEQHAGIYRYARLRVADEALAEDIASEVFSRLLAALREGGGPREHLAGWLYGVAARCIADHGRRRGRAERLDPSLDPPAPAPDPERRAAAALDARVLAGAMGHLTEDQQHVIALRYGAELPIRQVAEAMGRSEGAVKQLQARAVAALARHVAGAEEGGER